MGFHKITCSPDHIAQRDSGTMLGPSDTLHQDTISFNVCSYLGQAGKETALEVRMMLNIIQDHYLL